VGICYLLGCFVSCVIIITTWQSGSSFDQERLSVGGINANYIAYSLATGVPVLTSILMGIRNRSWFYLLVALFILLVFGMTISLTGCRSALYAYILGLCCFAIVVFRSRPGMGILVLAVFIVSAPFFFDKISTTLQTRLVTVSDSSDGAAGNNDLSGRLIVWPVALRLFSENPFAGVGVGAFPALNPLGIRAHNVFLSVAVELGVVGLFLYLLSLSLVFWRAFRLESFWGGKWPALSLLLVWLVIALAGVWEVSPAAWFAFAWLASIPVRRSYRCGQACRRGMQKANTAISIQ
jgi:O-antigen ligase